MALLLNKATHLQKHQLLAVESWVQDNCMSTAA